MTDWREVLLGDVCELKRGYDLPKGSRQEGAVPVVSSSGPTGFHSEAKVRGPGVVTGRYGTLGQVFYITENFWPLNTALYVRDFKGNDPRYVAALLESMDLSQHDGAAAVPGLNRNQLHSLPIRLPDLRVQGLIAGILGSVDDFIKNNRRRIDVLEQITQDIYREWFVYLRYPGTEGASLVDSGPRPVPDEWKRVTLGEVVSLDKGLSYKGAYLTEAGVPMANLKCFRPGGGFRRDGAKPYSGPFKAKHQVSPGDLILANTDLTQAGSVIGSPAFVPRTGFESGGIISHHVFVVRCSEPVMWPFLYETFRDDGFRDYARGVASGTTVLGLRPADVLRYSLAIPPVELLLRFDRLASDLLRIADNLNESAEGLKSMRDLLLPGLVTGQIDVSALDLDALVEKSVA